MSGPPYPHPKPAPGSNAIGSFIIGVSPIGTIPPFDVWETVISQYANSPTLTDLIQSFNAAMDQTQNFDAFYDQIWNVISAQGYGLDIWGRIVGVVRALSVPGDQEYFGFAEAGINVSGFNQQPFYSGATLTNNFDLADDAFRVLILAKAFANVCDGSIPATNSLLLSLFPGRGACYVRDNQDMTVDYVFTFVLQPVELAILSQTGVLPTATGVDYDIQQII